MNLHELLHDAAELAPTTLDRELRRPFPVRTTMAAAAAVVLVVAGATAISGQTGARHSAPPATEGPSTPQSRAQAGVDALVKDVVVPDDAVPQDSSPLPHLPRRATEYADPEHSVYASLFWTTGLSVDDTLAFLQSHEKPGLVTGGSGTLTGPGYVVKTLSGSDSRGELDISVEARPDGKTGIRADARVLWTPERSEQEKLGTVTSVDVTVVNGIPQHVDGTRTLTGEDAQHLADLVDSAAVLVGGPSTCTMDMGQGATLVFTRAGGQVTVTLSPACRSMSFDAGKDEPGLGFGEDLEKAVLSAVGRSDY